MFWICNRDPLETNARVKEKYIFNDLKTIYNKYSITLDFFFLFKNDSLQNYTIVKYALILYKLSY